MGKIKNLNIAIFIDRDVTIRHFLDSNTFDFLKKNNNVKLVFPPIGDKRISNHKNPEKFGFEYEFIKIPERRSQLWKWIFFIKILTYKKGKDWKVIRRVYSWAIGKKMTFFFKISTLPIVRLVVIKLIRLIIESYKVDNLNSFINSFKPDILIHPSTFQGVFINELALISNKLNIPFILLMNSWDNPCLKNSSIFEPSIVGVWGEQTKYHAVKYMGLPPHKVKILGSAQFQCFNKKAKKNKAEILQEYKFNKDSILILYAGSSLGSDEFRHLINLEKLCLDLDKNLKIIYRPHPWLRDISTTSKILNMDSNIIRIDKKMIPFMHKVINKEISHFYSTDYNYTHQLLEVSDIVISPLSTILIESLCHGKQSICLIPEDEDSAISFKDKKNLPCYKEVIECNSINTVTNIKNLKEALLLSYKKCQIKESGSINKKEAEFFVDINKPTYENRLIECIEELI